MNAIIALAILLSAGAADDSIVIVERPAVFELSVPVSRLVMTIPKAGLVRTEADASSSRRYFKLVDAERHLIVSGWFEPAEEFQELETMWKGETAAWARKGIPAPENVVFKKVGRWSAIAYTTPTPSGNHAHLRAHWVEAGTWIDVHLSTATDAPPAENAALLETFLGRIAVAEKPR